MGDTAGAAATQDLFKRAGPAAPAADLGDLRRQLVRGRRQAAAPPTPRLASRLARTDGARPSCWSWRG